MAAQQSAQTPVKVNSMDFEKGKNLADAVSSADGKTADEPVAATASTAVANAEKPTVGTPRASKQPNYKRHR